MITLEKTSLRLNPEGGKLLRANISFSKGDFVLVVGPNGSGKTSFLDLVAGVRVPDSGSVFLSVPDQSIAYAIQDVHGSLLPWRTIRSNILLPTKLIHGRPISGDRIDNLLDRFGLKKRASDFPYRLSGGEKQAVNFIRTICTPSPIRLFDEVTASLHSSFKSVARDLLSDPSDFTTLFVSHDMGDFSLPITRYVAIVEGTVQEISSSEAEELLSGV